MKCWISKYNGIRIQKFTLKYNFSMDNSFIENICGLFPSNFVPVIILDNSYVFENDPQFDAINLYNFFGQGATVNSFAECFYYVTEGWEPNKLTIIDIVMQIFPYLVFGLFIYFLLKKDLYKKTLENFKKINLVSFMSNIKNLVQKINGNFFMITFFAVQSFFTFDLVRTRAVKLKPFIDEYITLSSTVNFFKTLDFFAGDFIGGNYSTSLTSGPLSSVGAVIGWNLTNKFAIARIGNFYWIYFMQLIFILIIGKYYKKNMKFMFLVSNFALLLVPWWFGALYSIGEMASLILFTNAIFLFRKARNLSIILFSLCIVFGKLLNLVPFTGFYISMLFNEKKYKKIFNDFLVFCIPLTTWLVLVNYKYVNGNFLQYIIDQFNFIFTHQSSGAEITKQSVSINIFDSIFTGEFSTWNMYDQIRLLIVPILFIFLVYKNKEKINNIFGYISYPLIASILFSYLWFWFINTTKWIRYSQHFTVMVLIGLFYLLTFKVFDNKFDLFLSTALIGIFIENSKFLIIVLLFLSFFIIYFITKSINYNLTYFLIAFILLIDFTLPYFEKDQVADLNNIIRECELELTTIGCLDAYMNQ